MQHQCFNSLPLNYPNFVTLNLKLYTDASKYDLKKSTRAKHLKKGPPRWALDLFPTVSPYSFNHGRSI